MGCQVGVALGVAVRSSRSYIYSTIYSLASILFAATLCVLVNSGHGHGEMVEIRLSAWPLNQC